MSIIIREAQVDEVKVLQDLNDEIFLDNHKYDPDLRMDWSQSEDGGKKYFTELLNNKEAICLIAEVGGKPTGYIAASPKEIGYRKSQYIEIENMGVSPNHRSSGIGNQLMSKCLEIAKERGFQKAFVNCYIQNLKAIEFYKRNGYSEIDISLEKLL